MTTVVLPTRTADGSFAALGTTVRLVATGVEAGIAVARARADILDYHRRLSRFLPDSEICALNADPRPTVPASPLLRSAVRAGLWAAQRSRGLVDPCLLDALVSAGYDTSRARKGTDPLLAVFGTMPRAASPNAAARWRGIRVDDEPGTITRPPGLRLDLGGSGKGHIADLTARHFEQCREWVVDCGGDVLVGGAREVTVAHPLRSWPAARMEVEDGAIATSSVVSRAWTRADGKRAHHLLDPSSGEPVWTGLLSATALAPTTLHAETLAKMALLRGGDEARMALASHGGVLVHENGDVEVIA